MTTLKAEKRYKSVTEVRNFAVNFSGKLASTNKGDAATETITNTTYSVTGLTLAVVAATTLAITIDGSTVSTGQGVTGRVSGGTANTTYDILLICTTSLSQTIYGICPLKVIADSA